MANNNVYHTKNERNLCSYFYVLSHFWLFMGRHWIFCELFPSQLAEKMLLLLSAKMSYECFGADMCWMDLILLSWSENYARESHELRKFRLHNVAVLSPKRQIRCVNLLVHSTKTMKGKSFPDLEIIKVIYFQTWNFPWPNLFSFKKF